MSVAITIDNVVKRFGKDTIINGLSVDVPARRIFYVVGTFRLWQNYVAENDYRL